MGTTAEKLAYLNNTKTAIKDAIVAKGVEVPEGTTFRGYAEKIGEIKQSSSSDVLYKVNFGGGLDPWYPLEAKAGQYVFTTSGSISGAVNIYSTNMNYLATVAITVYTKEDLPPKIQEALNSIPQTYAPPPATSGYRYFVMPEEDVFIQYN